MKITSPYCHLNHIGLRGALHAHSTNSDGVNSPHEVWRAYAEKGFQFAALTDHCEQPTLEDLKTETGLITLSGCEYRPGGYTDWQCPEANVIGAPAPLPYGLTWDECCPALKETGAFVIYNHPNWDFDHWPCKKMLSLNVGHAVEIYNGSGDGLAVIIATPNYLHFDQGRCAMDNKLNVLLEFPHATTTDEGKDLLERSTKNNLILHVGLTHRLNARHRVFKPACARDSVKPLSYSISGTEACGKWYDSIPLTGGKFMGGMLPYLVDSVRDCMGPVVSISGTYSTKTKDGVEKGDVRGITMQFESGSVAQIVNVRNVSKPAHVFRHTILFDDNTIIEERKGKLQYTTPGMDDREEDLSNGAHSEIDTVMEDTACFIDAIRFPEHEDSTAVDAQETLRLVELAKNSIRESGAF